MPDTASDNVATDGSVTTSESDGIEWAKYAKRYDDFIVPMTCYQDNINTLKDFLISNAKNDASTRICDLGAGTGIYIKAMSEVLPLASFTHVDRSADMSSYASKRYASANLNINVIESAAEDLNFEAASMDIITAINVIYTLPEPKKRLEDIYNWLKPGGYFFVIDFGRRQNTADWTKYFLKELLVREGAIGTLKSIPSVLSLFRRQNEGAAAQDEGSYWIHSTSEFKSSLEAAGFSVDRAEPCYRGYSDLAICRKL